MATFFAKLSPCLIGMEACASSHYWGRVLTGMGHTVKWIAPQFVKPYVKGNKNDANDAEAICEAVGRPNMRFVPIKSVEQQEIQAVHRIRSELVQQRTAKVNHIRGLLGEYGIIVTQRIGSLRKALPAIQEDAENGLTGDFKVLLHGLHNDLITLDGRVAELDRTMQQLARTHAAAQRLQQLRGNAHLRTLLIHGARAVVKTAAGKEDRLSIWVQRLCRRRNKHIAAVALANKTVRLAWALFTSGADYQPDEGPLNGQPA